jgi:hypothetical protein
MAATVILFGGGDGGGLVIGPNGIKRIPPWNPDLAQGLKAVAALVQTSQRSSFGKSARQLAEQLCEQIVPAIVKGAEQSGGDASVLYAGYDDGFRCGSTGKKPIPLPPSQLMEKMVSGLAAMER